MTLTGIAIEVSPPVRGDLEQRPLGVIGLESAVAITAISRRTWWRRISAGLARRLPNVGGRTMLALSDVIPEISIPFSQEDLEMLVRAENGDAEAQADIGALFISANKHKAAFHWLKRAANQGSADAMHWIGMAYASGKGVPRDEVAAVMWIAKAASFGHVIAREQMHFIRVKEA